MRETIPRTEIKLCLHVQLFPYVSQIITKEKDLNIKNSIGEEKLSSTFQNPVGTTNIFVKKLSVAQQ